jgi:hypothetical protein
VISYPESNGREQDAPRVDPDQLGSSPSRSRVQKLALYSALLAAAVTGGDYACNKGGPAQKSVAAIRSGVTDPVKDPVAARREWRARLAERAVKIASGCECFSPDQKADFERRLAVCADDGEHMKLLQEIQDGADKVYFGEMGRLLPLEKTDVRSGDLIAAMDAADRKVPEIHDLVALRSAAAAFDRIGQHGMTSSLAIRRCEGVMAGDR